ncbi:MAG: glycine cleavage system protein H [Planctomycetota bacterium]|jgi:glycine cleavage system H protein
MKTENLKYSSKHNWVKFKRKIATVGVTDYLIDELGDLIDLSLPKVGDEVIPGISYGEIESVDVLSDLTSPVSGGVIKVNTDLATKLKALQKNPFGNSWFIKVRMLDAEQLDDLMDEDEYEEYKKSLKKKKKR